MEQSHNAIPEPFQAPEALLITGDALRDMTPDRLETISQMLSGLGLRTTTILDLESIHTPEEEPEPVPASKADFLRFAEENGHTERIAKITWSMVEVTATHGERGFKQFKHQEEPTGFPALSFLHDEDGTRYVDLRTVNERLKSGQQYEGNTYAAGAWSHGGEGKLSFLRAICVAKLGPDVENDDQ